MCLQKLAGNDVHQCGAQNLPSYVVYGDKAATGGALKTTPMMTSAQINASAAALGMSQLTQDRLQVRPAAAAAALLFAQLSTCQLPCNHESQYGDTTQKGAPRLTASAAFLLPADPPACGDHWAEPDAPEWHSREQQLRLQPWLDKHGHWRLWCNAGKQHWGQPFGSS